MNFETIEIDASFKCGPRLDVLVLGLRLFELTIASTSKL